VSLTINKPGLTGGLPLPGELLPNGTIVIAARPTGYGEGIVLALTNGRSSHDAYVVWRIGERNHTYSGFYTNSLNEAVVDYNERDR
jgi:hypothetical protein